MTDWKKEVEAKAYHSGFYNVGDMTPDGGEMVVSLEDALALLERCRVETLEDVRKVLRLEGYDAANAGAVIDMVRALKTQRKEGEE